MNWKLSARANGMTPSFIREVLKVSEQPGVISLAGGMPSPKTFPAKEVKEACVKILSDNSDAALQYATTEGFLPLREEVARMLPWNVDPSRVLITTGAQQGLDLVAKVLTDPGTPVLVETPTFLGALQAFQAMQAAPAAVPCDGEGPVPDALAAGAKGAAFAYLLPTFQNPTGRTTSEARRKQIIEATHSAGLTIVEDNPYGDLWYDQPPPLQLTARNPAASIYLGTFSKVLAPGLRLGYLIAPEAVYPKLVQAKQAADVHSSSFNQRVAAEVLRGGFLDRHMPGVRALYKRQRDTMSNALTQEMKGLGIEFNLPAGGMFMWVRLPVGLDAVTLLDKAIAQQVTFVPGAAFYAGPSDRRQLRLSFVTASESEIKEAIKRLADVIRQELQGSSGTS